MDAHHSRLSHPSLGFMRNGPLIVENDELEPVSTPTPLPTAKWSVLGQMAVRFPDSGLHRCVWTSSNASQSRFHEKRPTRHGERPA